MTPFWIVNFTKKDSCESFFETYWRAYLQNNTAASEDDKFFYLSHASELTADSLTTTATHLSVDVGGQKKLIPCFNNKMTDLNVFFLGDITEENTIDHLHLWAAELRKGLLEKRWGSLTDIRFYALLWRPESATASPGITKQSRGFLNELATLERLDINHRPFERVLFFQSSDTADQKPVAMERLWLSTLHMARSCRNIFLATDTRTFVDASATGIFFEAQIQREHEAYKLGQILMKDLAWSTSPEFYDRDEAAEIVNNNSDYLGTLSPKAIATAMKAGTPRNVDITTFDLPRPCHPLNLKVGRVWREYFGKYIVGMKRDLVNQLRRALVRYEEDYREKVYDNQCNFVKDRSQVLGNLVFDMFTSPVEDNKYRHVSLPQSMEILTRLRERIEQQSRDSLTAGVAFEMDENLERAAERAARNGWSAKHVLEVLCSRLRKLPVYNFARLARLIMLLAVLCFTLFHVLTLGGIGLEANTALWISVIVGAVLFLVDLFVYSNKVKRIESLKQQYIATMLMELRQRLEVEIVNCEKKTYEEMLQYADWLRRERLERLQNTLAVLAPPSFNFHESAVFQPLAGSMAQQDNDTRLIIPSNNFNTDTLRAATAVSGSFGKHPLIESAPFNKVNDDGNRIPLAEMVDANKDVSQRLVKKLMGEQRHVGAGTLRDVDFQRHESRRQLHESMLLLLDVSGSMYGQSLDDLKHYVNSLASEHNVDWIAFASEVVATSLEGGDVARLEADGGTSYVPAIGKAVEWMKSCLFDDIVLISDGSPSEGLDELIQAAKGLGQPLNTISIGTGGEAFLVELAHATGGKEITVESLQQVKERWNSEIRGALVTYNGQEYTFGQLMKLVHTEGCAQALHSFALQHIASAGINIAYALNNYGHKGGLEEWERASSQLNTLSQTSSAGNAAFYLTLNGTTDEAQKYAEKRNLMGTAYSLANTNHAAADSPTPADEPDMVAVLATFRPMSHISDLLWADFTTADNSLNHPLHTFLQGSSHALNIYNEPIK